MTELIASLLLTLFVVVAYIVIRREWVFRARMSWILRGDDVNKLPAFNEMLFTYWWVWSTTRLYYLKKQTDE